MNKILRKGFTLIELLIVIVIIGILAVAVLSAINPIEQIKKAQDAGVRSDSAELLNALERYFTAYQEYPWQRDSSPTDADFDNISMATVPSWISSDPASLIATDELKDEYAARNSLSAMYVFWNSGTDLARICFPPESQSNQTQASWTSAGVSTSAGGPDAVYMCVPE